MRPFSKKIVTDESNRPVAVQIDYQDWLEIERILEDNPAPAKVTDLSRYHGILKDLAEDPLEFQRRIRAEWDREWDRDAP
jgi:hypothetical protein